MDDDALVAAIEAAPGDPAPRLVYADWLEQRGDPRAELVRGAGELWRAPIDLARARHLLPRLRALRRTCDPGWLARVARPSLAELGRRVGLLAELDPKRGVFASERHGYRLNPPLPEEQVAAAEARAGCRLPEEYRRFVRELADGGAGPAYGVSPLAVPAGARLAEPFPAPPVVDRPLELSSPPGALEICELGCGSFYWLVCAGPAAGEVWLQGDAGFSPALTDAGARAGFLDWYAGWLEEALATIARTTPDGDDVLDRDPEHVTDVNLGGRGLTAVPDGLRRMTALRILDLSDNPIEELPPWLGELARLERLSLGTTKLRALPESLGDLRALVHLACNGTPTLERLPDSIGRLERLADLRVTSCGLVELPESIADLALSELDLFRNRLVRIPASIGRMKLRDLTLRLNRLTDLPDELAGLEELTDLALSGNPIRTLPACVGRLPRLERLWLGENPDLDLADAFRKLQHVPNLHRLSLGSARLVALPEEIGLLTRLEWLDLSWNRLTELPSSLANLPRLRHLNVQGNAAPLVARARELVSRASPE